MVIKTNFGISEPPQIPNNLPYYGINLITNAGFHESYEKALEDNTHVFSVGMIGRGKAQFVLFSRNAQYEKHPPIILNPSGTLEIHYRTDEELSELLSQLEDILITNDGKELYYRITSQSIPIKILEFENEILHLEMMKRDFLDSPKQGIGWIKENLDNIIEDIDKKIMTLRSKRFQLQQNRIKYKKGQVWSKRFKRFYNL